MRFSLIALATVLAFQTTSALAGGRTQETQGYIITMHEEVREDASALKDCVKEIRAIFKKEGSQMKVLTRFGIVTGNLTLRGASEAQDLRCVLAVEDDGEVHANPRTGRQN